MAKIIDKLIGRKIKEIKAIPDQAYVLCLLDNGDIFKMYHDWECCESVWLEDGFEDFKKLMGDEILMAECECSVENDDDGLEMWTFYKFGTQCNDATLRFNGCSNGYYSVDVEFGFASDSAEDLNGLWEKYKEKDYEYYKDENTFWEAK